MRQRPPLSSDFTLLSTLCSLKPHRRRRS